MLNGRMRAIPPTRVFVRAALCLLHCAVCTSTASAQQLLDRVLARVGADAITLTDVQAALGFGVVSVPLGEDARAAAVKQLIERRLVLVEVARLPPPAPTASEVDAEVGAMRQRAGDRADALLDATGLDGQRLRDLARDSLRIDAYLAQRFGPMVQASDAEARQYYDSHQQEFTRNGVLLPFEDAATEARARAAGARRQATVAQWISDLRARTDVVETTALTRP